MKPRPANSVQLNVLADRPRDGIGWGRRWSLRLWVLITVQVAMLLHILVWWIGMPLGWLTLSPVEPSEAIETASDGIVNAGAIFFAAALVSTALLGRWFCGWGCHVVLLQDWCLRLLRKGGIRPRAFRSRLLYVAPFALAVYMFIGPLFYRFVWAPWWEQRALEWPGFHFEILTRDLWASMPGVAVGLVFLFLCGFVTVYVLGAKGFCTYACPYGGFFAPIDRLSLRRVTVNDSCEGCAHCTAACTSNVRVHEQVATWGKVIDVGCMKTTDCIEACPNDALSIQWSVPALLPRRREGRPRPKRRWDIGLSGDIALGITMLASFLAWRGAYGVVPMLMSLGVASVVTWLCWKSWRVLRDKNVSFHRFQLKRSGIPTGAGVIFLLISSAAVLATMQAGASRYAGMQANVWAAGIRFEIAAPPKVGTSIYTSEEEARAAAAIEWYRLAGPVWQGGVGLGVDPNHLLAEARLRAGMGELDEAAELLDEVARTSKPNQQVEIERLMVAASRSGWPEVQAAAAAIIETHPRWGRFRRACVELALMRGDLPAAIAMAGEPDRWKFQALAELQSGRISAAIASMREYLAHAPGDALAWATLAQVLLETGDFAGADAAAASAVSNRDHLGKEATADLDRELAAFRARKSQLVR